jgi:hypothetical protein
MAFFQLLLFRTENRIFKCTEPTVMTDITHGRHGRALLVNSYLDIRTMEDCWAITFKPFERHLFLFKEINIDMPLVHKKSPPSPISVFPRMKVPSFPVFIRYICRRVQQQDFMSPLVRDKREKVPTNIRLVEVHSEISFYYEFFSIGVTLR